MTNLMSGGIEVWRKIPWTTISWSDVDKIYAMPVPWTSKSCPWQPPVDFTTHLPSVLWPIFTHLSDPQNQEPISRYSGNNLVLLKIYFYYIGKLVQNTCLILRTACFVAKPGHKDNLVAPVLGCGEWRRLIWGGGKEQATITSVSAPPGHHEHHEDYFTL